MINFNLKINDTVYCRKDRIKHYYDNKGKLVNKKIINLKDKQYKILDIDEYYDTLCYGKAICIVVENEIKSNIKYSIFNNIFIYWVLENEVYNDFIDTIDMFEDYFMSITEYRKIKLDKIYEQI